MEQLGTPHPEEWKGWLAWFGTLPLFLDLGRLRTVHASWDASAVNDHSRRSRELTRPRFEPWRKRAPPSTSTRRICSTRVDYCSLRVTYFSDKIGLSDARTSGLAGGSPRRQNLSRSCASRFRHGAGLAPHTDRLHQQETSPTMPRRAPRVFWALLPAAPPMPKKSRLPRNLACLDYSVANGGDLTAYRWDGESKLPSEKFVTSANRAKKKI